MKKRGVNVQPRTGETHGLFGVKFLKYHNIRDPDWTADDLITQYEKISNVYRKANRNAELQQEQDEIKFVEEFTRKKEEEKKLQEKLKVLLKGDVQRTKNTFQDNPEQQRKYKNKQSYDLKDELELQSFLTRKLTDKTMNERKQLINQYEEELMNAAFQQEVIRYYDSDKLKSEVEANKIFAPLKNSETRINAIRKEISSYKTIIDQLVKDSIYYQPVWDALQSDWKEQKELIKQVYSIGLPAIKNVKKLGTSMQKLLNVSKKEENQQQKEYFKSHQILEAYPVAIKQLIRSPSDFSLLGDRYERMTASMLDLKSNVEDTETTMKMLKEATLCRTYGEILPCMKMQPTVNINLKKQIDNRKKMRDEHVEKHELLKFAGELLLDGLPQIYNEELQKETSNLEKSVETQVKKQTSIENRMKMCGGQTVNLRYGLFHMVDVLRHVQSADFMKPLEYPTVDLKLPLLRSNAPLTPSVVNADISKLFDNMKNLSQSLMPIVLKEGNSPDLRSASKNFQKAMLEDAMLAARLL